MTSMKTMSRAIAAIALGGTLTIGSATLAGASGWGHSHDGPSQRAVPFSFSNNGTAVLVGTVSAISGDNITVTDPEGFSRAILVSSTTTYEQGGATSTIAAVVVGAKIFAQGTVDTNGTTLDALSIGVAGGGTKTQMGFDWGVVTAVTSSSVTIEGRSGTSTTFTYATTTPIDAIGHDKITLSSADLVVNEHAGVEFSTSAATTATGIWVELAHIDGVVTVVSGDNITISDNQGFTRLVLVGGATTYNNAGAAGTLTDVVVGARIKAEGLVDANGTTLDALNVDICAASSTTPDPQNHGHSGGHRHGGFGGGFGGGSGGGFGQGQGSNFRR